MRTDIAKWRTLVVGVASALSPIISGATKTLGIRSVEVCEDGERAVRLIRAAKPRYDLVICDWDAPQLAGVDVLKALRGAGETVGFLMLTAPYDPASVVLAKRHGVTDCLVKPFSQAQLEVKLRAVAA